jgi:hypothetical protein
MEQLRKIGKACLVHYEKIILSLMLVLLAVAVWILFQETQHEAQKLQEFKTRLVKGKTHPVKTMDLSTNAALRQMAQKPRWMSWVGTNNLFNPVKWQQSAGGALIKVQSGKEVGPEALVITGIRPLHFIVRCENPTSNGCYLSFTNEMVSPGRRPKQQVFISPSSLDKTNRFYDFAALTNRLFVPRQMKGAPDDPEWTLELDNSERIAVTKEKPYVRVDGYEADLKYPVNNKLFSKLRAGANYVVRLEGEEYKVVAINEREVVLSARLNDQQTTVTRMAPP